jgi:hypothetical protein
VKFFPETALTRAEIYISMDDLAQMHTPEDGEAKKK